MIKQRFRRGVLPISIALVLLLAWTPTAAAQEQTERVRKNSVYAEVFGSSAIGLTLNYERKLTPRLKVRLGGGVSSREFDTQDAESASC